MIKFSLLLLLLASPLVQANTSLSPPLKDPFMISSLISCEQLTDNLLSLFDRWQYSGHVEALSTDHKIMAIIQSIDNKVWFNINNSAAPAPFLPWQIKTISTSFIQWQADLPVYCEKPLTFVMKLQGK